jgi:hypothetical protein
MIEHQDYIDFTTVPQSKGLSSGTIVIVIIGVIMIFIMGGLSSFLSGYGHMWPSTHTERMDLGNMPSQIQ